MRLVVALLLFFHGFAHLVGFGGSWRLSPNLPYRTTVLGVVDVGAAGAKVLGVIWLALALAFAAAAIATARDVAWWPTLVAATAVTSLAMCALALPEAVIGLVLNALLLIALVTGRRLEWLP